MYFYISQNFPLKKSDVLGIFDIEHTTTTETTREYLSKAQKRFEVVNVNSTVCIPNSFIVTVNKNGNRTIYLSQFSTKTLTKRFKEKSNNA